MDFYAKFYLVLATLVLAASGCAGTIANGGKVVEAGSLTKYARQDLYVKVDDVPAVLGTLVVPYKPGYRITIATSAKLDVVFIENCHRHWVEYDVGTEYKDSAGGRGWMYSFNYVLNAEAEKHACPLMISTLEKDGRRKSYATIAVQEPAYELKAAVHCNGKKSQAVGVALCQGKVGKFQEFHFEEQVKMFSPRPECPLPAKSEGKDFEFPLAKGTCRYSFSTFASPHKRMHLQTIGYEADEYEGEL